MSDTHYEVLGVSPDASRDEIRDAYRARVSELDPESWKGDASERRERAASVNKAWNVLSDPFQKERYDSGIDDSIEGIDDIDGDGNQNGNQDGNGSGKPARGNAAAVAQRGTAAVKLTPTGLTIAPTRARINALSVDVLVILVLVFGLTWLSSALFNEPAVQVTVDGTVVKTVNLDGRPYDTVAPRVEKQALAEWKKDNDKPTKPKHNAEKATVPQVGPALASQLLTLILAIGYTVIPTVRTSQTLGKRIFKIKLVSLDGGHAGWAQSLLHYGIPLTVAVGFGAALGLLAPIAAIGMILWSIWDKNGQGVDDKIAKTFVVEV